MQGIVNVRYTVGSLHFDAAIDYGHVLHPYTYGQSQMLPVELYCLDHEDWDIEMMFFADGVVDWNKVVERTTQWVNEMIEEGSY